MADTRYGTIAGDPDVVAAKARKYQDIADAIQRSTTTLDDIANQVQQKSLAMDKTRALAQEVSKDIGKALARYRQTGDALVEYAPVLREARDAGNPAAEQIARLEQELWGARLAEQNASWEAQHTTAASGASPADVDEATRAATRARTHRKDLEDALTAAHTTWQDAEDKKEGAAQQARSKIQDVVSGAHVELEDSTWDKVKFYAGKAYEIFKVICDVAGVLSIFLAWVPGLGEILLALAAIGAILSVVEAAVNVATGEGSWGDLLLASGMAVLTIFGGKLLTLGADFVKAKGVATAVETVGRSAAKAELGEKVVTEGLVTARVGTKRAVLKMLNSPLTRDEAQLKLYNAYRTSTDKVATARSNMLASFRDAFPAKPFKDGAARWVLGNDSVTSMVKLGMEHGEYLTTAQQLAATGVTLGAHANSMFSVFRAGAGVYSAAQGGDPLSVATGIAGIATRPMDGSYGDMVGSVDDGANLVKIIDSMV